MPGIFWHFPAISGKKGKRTEAHLHFKFSLLNFEK